MKELAKVFIVDALSNAGGLHDEGVHWRQGPAIGGTRLRSRREGSNVKGLLYRRNRALSLSSSSRSRTAPYWTDAVEERRRPASRWQSLQGRTLTRSGSSPCRWKSSLLVSSHGNGTGNASLPGTTDTNCTSALLKSYSSAREEACMPACQ